MGSVFPRTSCIVHTVVARDSKKAPVTPALALIHTALPPPLPHAPSDSRLSPSAGSPQAATAASTSSENIPRPRPPPPPPPPPPQQQQQQQQREVPAAKSPLRRREWGAASRKQHKPNALPPPARQDAAPPRQERKASDGAAGSLVLRELRSQQQQQWKLWEQQKKQQQQQQQQQSQGFCPTALGLQRQEWERADTRAGAAVGAVGAAAAGVSPPKASSTSGWHQQQQPQFAVIGLVGGNFADRVLLMPTTREGKEFMAGLPEKTSGGMGKMEWKDEGAGGVDCVVVLGVLGWMARVMFGVCIWWLRVLLVLLVFWRRFGVGFAPTTSGRGRCIRGHPLWLCLAGSISSCRACLSLSSFSAAVAFRLPSPPPPPPLRFGGCCPCVSHLPLSPILDVVPLCWTDSQGFQHTVPLTRVKSKADVANPLLMLATLLAWTAELPPGALPEKRRIVLPECLLPGASWCVFVHELHGSVELLSLKIVACIVTFTLLSSVFPLMIEMCFRRCMSIAGYAMSSMMSFFFSRAFFLG